MPVAGTHFGRSALNETKKSLLLKKKFSTGKDVFVKKNWNWSSQDIISFQFSPV